MKTKLMTLIKWFCLRLAYNDLASVVVILHEVLSGSRKDIRLKPEERPPHYRDFRIDTVGPLKAPPEAVPPRVSGDWQALLRQHEQSHGRKLVPIKRRQGAAIPPPGCRCEHCGAPRKYLYVNNGRQASQVLCKICGQTSPTHRVRRESGAEYWCPHCGRPLSLWKSSSVCTIFKCFSYTCPEYVRKRRALTEEEKRKRREQKYDPNYKLHYQYREYHLDPADLQPARPDRHGSKVDLSRIHNDMHTVGLVLTFMVNLGLSSRVTRDALEGIFAIKISHQACINYLNAVAARVSRLVDRCAPDPGDRVAADETYIIVENRWHYTWFGIDAETRAICGYNLSGSRDTQSALALLHDCFGTPGQCTWEGKLITDGNTSYDSALMAYNAGMSEDRPPLDKRTVIGLENLDPESAEYRRFKQLVERLNRTYKYHTRPRAGFKTFEGAVTLTTLFVAYYNFMRPHSALDSHPPVRLQCLEGVTLMPQAWLALIREAA
jgi:putative transposase